MKSLLKIAAFVGLIAGLASSAAANTHQAANPLDQQPPFTKFECEASWGPLSFMIDHHRTSYGTGPAHVQGARVSWIGGWSWSKAPEGTRLSGYYILKVHGAQWPSGGGPLDFSAYYNPNFGIFTNELLRYPSSNEHDPVKCEVVL